MPSRFVRARSSGPRHIRGLSWVKDTAHALIRAMRDIAELLERSGHYRVTVVVTARPGYIVYEDGQQIVAEPFTSTPTK